jgi:hypothetical protein
MHYLAFHEVDAIVAVAKFFRVRLSAMSAPCDAPERVRHTLCASVLKADSISSLNSFLTPHCFRLVDFICILLLRSPLSLSLSLSL